MILATQVYEPCPRDDLVPHSRILEDVAAKPASPKESDSSLTAEALGV